MTEYNIKLITHSYVDYGLSWTERPHIYIWSNSLKEHTSLPNTVETEITFHEVIFKYAEDMT